MNQERVEGFKEFHNEVYVFVTNDILILYNAPTICGGEVT